MATAKRYNDSGGEQSDLQLPDALFEAPVHEQALYEAVNAYLAHQRQGNAKTKERGEVAYSTAKLYRQKGTGRARAGSARSPIRVGGGTIFGPKPRDFRTRLNRKVRKLALRSALSDRAQLGAVHVIESPDLQAPKTKLAASMLEKMGLKGKTVLFVTADNDPILFMSLRNLKQVDIVRASQLNPYLVLRSENLVFTETALEQATEVFS